MPDMRQLSCISSCNTCEQNTPSSYWKLFEKPSLGAWLHNVVEYNFISTHVDITQNLMHYTLSPRELPGPPCGGKRG